MVLINLFKTVENYDGNSIIASQYDMEQSELFPFVQKKKKKTSFILHMLEVYKLILSSPILSPLPILIYVSGFSFEEMFFYKLNALNLILNKYHPTNNSALCFCFSVCSNLSFLKCWLHSSKRLASNFIKDLLNRNLAESTSCFV